MVIVSHAGEAGRHPPGGHETITILGEFLTLICLRTTRHTARHCTALHIALHCTTLHYTTLHYTTLHYTTLHYTTLHYTTLHYTTLHYTTLHYTTLHYTTLVCGSAHRAALHLHYTTHCIYLHAHRHTHPSG